MLLPPCVRRRVCAQAVVLTHVPRLRQHANWSAVVVVAMGIAGCCLLPYQECVRRECRQYCVAEEGTHTVGGSGCIDLPAVDVFSCARRSVFLREGLLLPIGRSTATSVPLNTTFRDGLALGNTQGVCGGRSPVRARAQESHKLLPFA